VHDPDHSRPLRYEHSELAIAISPAAFLFLVFEIFSAAGAHEKGYSALSRSKNWPKLARALTPKSSILSLFTSSNTSSFAHQLSYTRAISCNTTYIALILAFSSFP
jgi:hypothetical protein